MYIRWISRVKFLNNKTNNEVTVAAQKSGEGTLATE